MTARVLYACARDNRDVPVKPRTMFDRPITMGAAGNAEHLDALRTNFDQMSEREKQRHFKKALQDQGIDTTTMNFGWVVRPSLFLCFRCVPKFWTHVRKVYACAQRLGLPQVCGCG